MTSYTASARFTLQVPGTNNNTWGAILNTGVFGLVDDNINGRVAFMLSGTKTLTSVNGATDEARNAIIDVTGGSGGTVVIPNVTKAYLVRNGASGVTTIKTSGGVTNADIQPGEVVGVMCDASAVYRVVPTDLSGVRLSDLADPTNPQDAATKAYADALAFTANAGILPGQGGNAGKFLITNGTVASWASVDGSNIPSFSASAAAIWLGTTAVSAVTPGGFYTSAAEVTITFASTMTPDMSTFMNGVVTMTGNATLANPTNAKPGQTGRIRFIQDSTGSRTLAVGANWKRDGGALPLSTAANAIDILEFDVITSSYILYNLLRSPS